MDSALQFWANISQIVSLFIAVAALFLQIITWIQPNKPSLPLLIRRLKPLLPYVIVATISFLLGSQLSTRAALAPTASSPSNSSDSIIPTTPPVVQGIATSSANPVVNSQPPVANLSPTSAISVNSTTTVPSSPNSPTFSVNKVFPSNVDDLQLTVATVDFLSTNRMRWHVSFYNTGTENITLNLWYWECYINDKIGNKYELVTDKDGRKQGFVQLLEIEAGVRKDYWFDFSGPDIETDTFTVHLKGGSVVADYLFPPFTVALTNSS